MRGGLEIYLTLEQPSPEYIDCYRTPGVAFSHLHKYKEGIADVSIGIKLRKDDPKLLYERGYLEEKAGLKKKRFRISSCGNALCRCVRANGGSRGLMGQGLNRKPMRCG